MALIAETPRLKIQTWELTDTNALCKLTAQEGISDYSIRGYANYTTEQAKLWIERELMRYRQSGLGKFAVILKETRQPIGIIGLFKMAPPQDTDVELMCRFPLKNRAQGYATEAAKGLFNYGFETLRLREIHGHRFLDNQPAVVFLRRLGFSLGSIVSYEGVPADQWKLPNLESSVSLEK